ncbi:hypothetical protein J7L06_11035 [Candidatus Bathyarchaeota archaeon]|nr:hypothetical protein [Candidatus Bathyarchaeota archaeon]
MKGKRCDYCGREVALPFRCHLCGGTFCAEHRLPESHRCPELWKARAPKRRVPSVKVKTPLTRRKPSYIPYRFEATRSLTEVKHLAVSALLVTGVGMSLMYGYLTILGPLKLTALGLMFTLSFLAHELSHKYSAKREGLWAEFRLTPIGALITLISIAPIPIKLISPGAVIVMPSPDRRTGGKLSLAGPLANIIIAAALSVPTYLIPLGFTVRLILRFVALFNAYIALFNLIPFGQLDGLKVIMWSKAAWATAFVASAGLTVLLYLHP